MGDWPHIDEIFDDLAGFCTQQDSASELDVAACTADQKQPAERTDYSAHVIQFLGQLTGATDADVPYFAQMTEPRSIAWQAVPVPSLLPDPHYRPPIAAQRA